jgi:DNA-binding NarL/FixJ family response regulator
VITVVVFTPPGDGGSGNGAVARRLPILPHTGNTQLRRVFAKLGVPDRVALAAVAHHPIK